MFAIFRLLPGTAHVLRAAGDPVPLLRDAGFTDVAVAGGWRGTASFWTGRKPCA